MRRTFLAATIGLITGAAPLAAQHNHADMASPYAEDRSDIAALSATELGQLERGEGMGFARAAELNSFPGPRHLIDMGDHLGLSEEQLEAIEAIRVRMAERAQDLGTRVIEAERALDDLFKERSLDEDALLEHTLRIGELRGRLRAVHLVAHLEVTRLLTEEQVVMYDRMRGYAGERP